ncbi:hypothetical protein ES332_D12G204600v1 [Gossypium tomentosum]|uniref:Uncharacterized protein n=1 Tax=Gossypium tomentosum TaxID=34277 RepID=A0A5D2ID47_GOSTO|nr:hypothetical protein ES332_D12G204600v1 [Gossypium tomentosum]
MEHSRNQRLMLLLAEKELQAHKSQVLESKLARIGSMERSCLFLDQKIASQNFRISALKSDIENLDTKYDSSSQKLKAVKSEIEELEEVEKERECKEVFDGNSNSNARIEEQCKRGNNGYRVVLR